MEYSVGHTGRVVTIKLSEDDDLSESICHIAREEGIARAVFWLIGATKSATVTKGPKPIEGDQILPFQVAINSPHETLATGTLFPDESGKMVPHIHGVFGSPTSDTIAGCASKDLKAWIVIEVILLEIIDKHCKRRSDSNGFSLLHIHR